MKRYLVYFLALLMMLSLAGCGDSIGAPGDIEDLPAHDQTPPQSTETDYEQIDIPSEQPGVVNGAGETALPALRNYQTISASVSGKNSIAIKEDGSVWGWGVNEYCLVETTDESLIISPTQIMDDAVAVSSGQYHRLAIKRDGSLWVWGQNMFGVLGVNADFADAPVKIMDDAVAIATSQYHSLVLKSDGSLWAWGRNKYGQLGDGTTEDRYTPVKIMDGVISISAGYMHSVAVKEDNSLWAWGWNGFGQLGNGTTEDCYTPTKIMDDVAIISAGGSHTLAVKKNSSLWAWGNNDCGQVGNGSDSNIQNIPVMVMDDVVAISAQSHSYGHSHAIKSDNSLWSWGSNTMGRLGDSTVEWKNTPIKVMDDVLAISAGDSFCLALKLDGSLWGWGSSAFGALVIGIDQEYIVEPTKIMTGIKTE